MIEYLKIEIIPKCFAETEVRELSIRIDVNGERFEKREHLYPNDLVSYFDRIFECSKKEFLKVLKEAETPSPVPVGVPEMLTNIQKRL